MGIVTDHPVHFRLAPVTAPRRTTPLCVEELVGAMLSLPTPSGLLDPALLLAVPLADVPSIAVEITASTLTYRGHYVPCPAPDVEAIARAVTTLVATTSRPGDEYIDPTSLPFTWARLVRSGAKKVMFGTSELLGLPLLSANPDVPDDAVYAVLAALLSGEVPLGPATCTIGATKVVLIGGQHSLSLSLPRAAVAPRANIDIEQLATSLSQELHATSVAVMVEEGEMALQLSVDDMTILVPLEVRGGGAALGYIGDLEVTPRRPSRQLPSGWVHLGPASNNKGDVVLHSPSRIRALAL